MLLNPWNRTARFALVGLAMLMLGVGACSTSTTTELAMGQKVTINLADKSFPDITAIDTDLTAFLDTYPGIERVNILLNEGTNGSAYFDIVAWGSSLVADQLVADLRRAVPALADQDIQTDLLTGTVNESYADKLKREVFQIEIDGATEEEIRAQIMAQLAEQGVAEGAVVDVQITDGKTEIIMTVDVESDE